MASITPVNGRVAFLALEDPHTYYELQATGTGSSAGQNHGTAGTSDDINVTSVGTQESYSGLNVAETDFANHQFDTQIVTDAAMLLYLPAGLSHGQVYGIFHNGGGTHAQSIFVRATSTGVEVAATHNASGTPQDNVIHEIPDADLPGWFAVSAQYASSDNNQGDMALWINGVKVRSGTRTTQLQYGSGNPQLGDSNADHPLESACLDPSDYSGGDWGAEATINGSGILIANFTVDNPNGSNTAPDGAGDVFHQAYYAAHSPAPLVIDADIDVTPIHWTTTAANAGATLAYNMDDLSPTGDNQGSDGERITSTSGATLGSPLTAASLGSWVWDGTDTNDRITVQNSDAINTQSVIDGGGGRSIAVVVDVADATTLTPHAIWGQGGGSRGLSLYIYDGDLVFNAWNNPTGDGPGDAWGDNGTTVDVRTPITDGVHHIVAVYTSESSGDAYDGTLELYIDGSLAQTTSSGVGALYAHSGDVSLGGINDDFVEGTNVNRVFQGAIDGLAYFSSAIDSTLVGQLYASTLSGWGAAFVPDPSVTATSEEGTNVDATAVVGAFTIPAPGVTAESSATITPVSVTGASSVPSPTVEAATSAEVSPVVVTATPTTPTPAITTGADILHSAVASVAVVPQPTVIAESNATISPSVVASTSTIPAPSVTEQANATVTPLAISSQASVPSSSVEGGAGNQLSPLTVAVTSTVSDPVVIAESTASISPNVVVATSTIPSPTVDATTEATATPVSVVGSSTVPNPTITATATISPVAVAPVVGVPSPTVLTPLGIAPSVVVGTASVPGVVVVAEGGLFVGWGIPYR